ncbi:hypothetical protein [Agromyces sp. NBRC 114283]|uniref:hypothetical protein n=1 Tax=Agromyces sp. NBRC 114283 TaxID=2994521 RepID=UPI0024A35065|nr:hypothetical protein [Agromyces sp. NBRC 114283]GLU88543.1 hypothetical protein Agsp01_07980 [Agromyces sp. NBRC 114283]
MSRGAPGAAPAARAGGAGGAASGAAPWLAFGAWQLAMLAVMVFAMTTGPHPLAQFGAALLLVALAGVDAVRARRGRHDPRMVLDGLAMAGLVALPFLLPASGHHPGGTAGGAADGGALPAALAAAIAVGWWLGRAAPLIRAGRRALRPEPIAVAGVAVSGAMVLVMAAMHVVGAHP